MQVTGTNVVVQQVLSEYLGKTVALLSDGTVCKWGPGVSATEAASMRFVAEKTSVPAPKVLNCTPLGPSDGSGEGKGHSIVMTRVLGQSLEKVWGDLDEETKRIVATELVQYLDQLHALKGSFIGSIDGTPTREPNLEERLRLKITLPSVASFHDLVVQQVAPHISRVFCDYARRAFNDQQDIVFSHAEIWRNKFQTRANIMIEGGHVTGLTGWGSAGYYPQCWDATKALFEADWHSGWPGLLCGMAHVDPGDIISYQDCTKVYRAQTDLNRQHVERLLATARSIKNPAA